MAKVTERQRDIVEFIRQFIRDNGYSPTVRQVGTKFNISPNGVMSHLKALEKKGLITRDPITLISKGDNFLDQPDEEGWWWYRRDDHHRWVVLDVFRGVECRQWWAAENRHLPSTHHAIENLCGQWYGPINKPTDDP